MFFAAVAALLAAGWSLKSNETCRYFYYLISGTEKKHKEHTSVMKKKLLIKINEIKEQRIEINYFIKNRTRLAFS